MAELVERRKMPRVRIAGQLGGRARATLDVRLLDLSVSGARIAHYEVLRPSAPCSFQLPSAIGAATLPARIVWSRLVGSERNEAGERILCYQSGLVFTSLTDEQRAALESVVARITPSGGLGLISLIL